MVCAHVTHVVVAIRHFSNTDTRDRDLRNSTDVVRLAIKEKLQLEAEVLEGEAVQGTNVSRCPRRIQQGVVRRGRKNVRAQRRVHRVEPRGSIRRLIDGLPIKLIHLSLNHNIQSVK